MFTLYSMLDFLLSSMMAMAVILWAIIFWGFILYVVSFVVAFFIGKHEEFKEIESKIRKRILPHYDIKYKYLLDKYKHFEGKRVIVRKNNTVELLDKLDELKITKSWTGASKIEDNRVLYIKEVWIRKTNQWTPFRKKWKVILKLGKKMEFDEYEDEEGIDYVIILDKELEKSLIKENLLPAK
jgi:hypothetical protein